jgi:hypothetical protein
MTTGIYWYYRYFYYIYMRLCFAQLGASSLAICVLLKLLADNRNSVVIEVPVGRS